MFRIHTEERGRDAAPSELRIRAVLAPAGVQRIETKPYTKSLAYTGANTLAKGSPVAKGGHIMTIRKVVGMHRSH